MRHLHRDVVQMVEHTVRNREVVGSSPAIPTKKEARTSEVRNIVINTIGCILA